MSTSRSSPRRWSLPASAAVAAAALTAVPAALAWPAGTCEPSKDKTCTVDVAIAKASDRDAYAPGDTARYTIAVTNTGDTAVARERILVADPALADLAPQEPATGWLSPGETAVWTGTRVVTPADCGDLPNTATVALAPSKEGGADANPGNDAATRTVVVSGGACAPPEAPVFPLPIVVFPAAVAPSVAAAGRPAGGAVCPRPAMAVAVRGPATPTAGTTATYRVAVRAAGATATGVRLTLRLPAGFSAPAAGPGRVRGGAVAVGVGRLAAGTARIVPVLLRLDRSARGAGTLRAAVTARCGGAAATARTVRTVAVAPIRVQPAVTG